MAATRTPHGNFDAIAGRAENDWPFSYPGQLYLEACGRSSLAGLAEGESADSLRWDADRSTSLGEPGTAPRARDALEGMRPVGQGRRMLDPLTAALATFGPALKDEAVAKLVDALLDSDDEVRERLERIESKIDILLSQPAGTARDLLSDAMKPHRSPGDARALIEQARLEFTKAVNSPTDHLSRSVAALWVAICWFCLTHPEDARDWAARAANEAHGSLYELAVEFNSSCNKVWPGRDRRRLQQLIEEANQWELAVRSIRKVLGTPEWNIPVVSVKYGWRKGQNKYIFAQIDACLYPAMTLEIGGIKVTFLQFAILNSGSIDAEIGVTLARNQGHALSSRPSRILNQKPVHRHERPDKLPVLTHGWRHWIVLSGKRKTEVDGWRRFAGTMVVGGDYVRDALEIEPGGVPKNFPPLDPRPKIAVTLLCRSPNA